MKRFAICAVIFPMLLVLGALCMSRLTHVRDETIQSVDAITQAADKGDIDTAHRLALQLQQDWEEHEHSIMSFVRHGKLDEITRSIAKLPAYIQNEEHASLQAETDTIRRMITHIWDSERFLPRNIV